VEILNQRHHWVEIGDHWDEYNENGKRHVGWVKLGKYWYFMANDGRMQTGWIQVGKSWYFMNTSEIL
jgi:glucan-binding YG repeat protein